MTNTENEATRVFRHLIESSPELARIFQPAQMPRYLYFSVLTRRGSWRYCWTTERIEGRFASWVYRPNPRGWTIIKRRDFKRRSSAKHRAIRMRDAHERRIGDAPSPARVHPQDAVAAC